MLFLSHTKLLAKNLCAYGIGTELQSNLTYTSVCIGILFYLPMHSDSVKPLGAVLGPMVFLLFINDLPADQNFRP